MRNIFAVAFLIVMSNCSAQLLSKHSFTFKGYNLQPMAMATDGNGTFAFAARVKFVEGSTQSDPQLDKVMHKGTALGQCVVLLTDAQFNIKKIWGFDQLFPSNIVYEPTTKMFWLGGSEYQPNSTWQMAFVQLSPDGQKKQYNYVDTNFSCKLADFVFDKKELVCTAVNDTLAFEKAKQVPVVVKLSATKFHSAKRNALLGLPKDAVGFKAHDIISVAKADTKPVRELMLTSAAMSKGILWFGASDYPFGEHKPISIFQFDDGKFTEEEFMPAQDNMRLLFLTNLRVLKDGNLLLSYLGNITDKFYMVEKVSPYYKRIWKQTVPDKQNAGFYNQVIELPNGKIIAAGANANKTWSFFVYGSDGRLMREIDTQQPIAMQLAFAKALNEGKFVCSFSDHKSDAGAEIVVIGTE